MALAPRLALIPGANQDTGKVVKGFQNALLSLKGKDPDTLARNKTMMQNELLQTQIDTSAFNLDTARNKQRLGGVAQASLELQGPLQRAMQSGDITEVDNILTGRIANLQSRQQAGEDVDATESIEALQQLRAEGPQALFNTANDVINVARQTGVLSQLPGSIASEKFIGTPQRVKRDIVNPDTGKVESKNFLVGVAQKVDGSFGLQEIPVDGEFVSTLGETGEKQTDRLIRESGGKEAAKLSAQLKLEPTVKAAVASAVGEVSRLAREAETIKSNETALKVYETGVNGLTSALHDTSTGPFVGFIPAITASQQTANGAVAAMAPILKQMFRSAGEGNFTDSDQKLLLDMVPTRKDKPAARLAKLQNIDAIVRAKLSIQPRQPASEQPLPTQQQTGGIKFLGFE
jgi:hypothetical protein